MPPDGGDFDLPGVPKGGQAHHEHRSAMTKLQKTLDITRDGSARPKGTSNCGQPSNNLWKPIGNLGKRPPKIT